MSQGDLVSAMGRRGVRLSISSLSRVENGQREPGSGLLHVLSAVLGPLEGLEEPPDVEPDELSPDRAFAAAVGLRIREARRAAGITQGELATKVIDLGETSTTPSIISRYETGNVLPGLQRIAAIATALGVPVDLLVNGDLGDRDEVDLVRAYRAGGLPGVLQWCTTRVSR